MTTIDSSPGEVVGGETTAVGRMLAAEVDWLTTTDHKKVGRLFIGAGLLGFLATVVINVVMSVERIDGADVTLDADSFGQILSGQRVGLIFGSALPLAVGLAIAVVPLQLGARSIAFPRLAVAGFWMWFGGVVLNLIALSNNGGPGGGDTDMVDLWLASVGVMALGLAAAGGSLATSVLTTRAPGMTMRRVPFFSWSVLVFAIGLLLVAPVLFGAVIYLIVDHRSGARGAFGGNDGILQWIGWAFTQPTTILFTIVAVGVFADLVPSVFGKRTPMRGVMYAGISLVGVAALAGVTQQNRFELPWAGSGLTIEDSDDFATKLGDVLPWAFFHLLPILGATIVFLMALFIAKPEKGVRPRFDPGFLFALGGLLMVLVGMFGAAIEPILDFGLVATVFGEGVLIYLVYGTALTVMGGIVEWAPKLWGRTLDGKKVAPLALLGFGATILAGFPQYIAGFLDQPAGLSYDDSDLTGWNIIVLVGHGLMALTVLIFIGLLISTMTGSGDDAVDDPYDGQTIEWATTSPAPRDNFVDLPTITSAEPLLDMKKANSADSGEEA